VNRRKQRNAKAERSRSKQRARDRSSYRASGERGGRGRRSLRHESGGDAAGKVESVRAARAVREARHGWGEADRASGTRRGHRRECTRGARALRASESESWKRESGSERRDERAGRRKPDGTGGTSIGTSGRRLKSSGRLAESETKQPSVLDGDTLKSNVRSGASARRGWRELPESRARSRGVSASPRGESDASMRVELARSG
jgi:hypothetical protein